MIFELIVVDTKEQAEGYSVKNEDNHVQKAVFVGQSLCGLHYQGQRPNKLTRLHRPLETALEREWNSEILMKALDRRGIVR